MEYVNKRTSNKQRGLISYFRNTFVVGTDGTNNDKYVEDSIVHQSQIVYK